MNKASHIIGKPGEKSCLSANCEVCKIRMHEQLHVVELPGVQPRSSIRCAEHCPECNPLGLKA